MATLEELIALGNEGAPQEWLDNFTGKGIGDGYEGVHGEELKKIMKSLPKVDQEIEATYEIQFPIACNSTNYTKGRQGQKIEYIVVHYTAGAQTAEGAALANCKYFSGANRGASAHFFIDDGYTIMQSVSLSDTAWHAGNWNINIRSIGIEVCTAGAFTEKEIERLTWLVQKLMADYGIPANRVIRHYDANGKRCPAYYVDQNRWNELHARITSGPVASTTQSKRVQMYTPNGSEAQQWKIKWNDERTHVTLTNVRFGLALDVMGGGTTSGTGVWVYTPNGMPAQQWKIIRKEGDYLPEQARPVELAPAVNENLRLDVAGASTENGAGLQIYEANDTPAQKWIIADQGGAVWELINNGNGAKLALDVPW